MFQDFSRAILSSGQDQLLATTADQTQILTWLGTYVDLTTVTPTIEKLPLLTATAMRLMYGRATEHVQDQGGDFYTRVTNTPDTPLWANCGDSADLFIRVLSAFGMEARRISAVNWTTFDHVATEYYSETYKKMVYYDPLYGTIFLDQAGTPASLAEILSEMTSSGYDTAAKIANWSIAAYRINGLDSTGTVSAADPRYDYYDNIAYEQDIIRGYFRILIGRNEDLRSIAGDYPMGSTVPGGGVASGSWTVYDNTATAPDGQYYTADFWSAFDNIYNIAGTGRYQLTYTALGTTDFDGSHSPDFDADRRADLLATDAGGDYLLSTDGGQTYSALSSAAVSGRFLGLADADGDGYCDVILKDDAGAVTAAKVVDGALTTLRGYAAESGDALAVADFTKDGVQDLLLQVDAGTFRLMEYDGTLSRRITTFSAPVGAAALLGIGDFTGDGGQDLLWRKDSGELIISFHAYGSWSSITSQTVPAAGYSLVGLADVNADGIDEIIFQGPDNHLHAWFLRDGGLVGAGFVGEVPDGATVSGFADMDGDGRRDLLTILSDGSLAVGLLRTTNYLYPVSVGTAPDGLLATAGLLGVAATGASSETRSVGADFGKDGASEIIIRGADGSTTAYSWHISGTMVANTMPDLPTQWSLGAIGDLDGDGVADLLWRNTDGRLYLYYMRDTWVQTGTAFGSLGSSDTLVGIVDLDGNGRGEIIWRNNGTYEAVSPAAGTSVTLTAPAANLYLVASADFDHDGRHDLVWRSLSGDITIAMGYGTAYESAVTIALGIDWSIAAAGDFTGDGKGDLLLRQASGRSYLWFMDGGRIAGGAEFGTIAANRTIVGVADYTGDNRVDLLVQDGSGAVAVITAGDGMWATEVSYATSLASGTAVGPMFGDEAAAQRIGATTTPFDFDDNGRADVVTTGIAHATIYLAETGNNLRAETDTMLGSGWRIDAMGDVNGDRKTDFILRNDEGAIYLWQMSGRSIASGRAIGPGTLSAADKVLGSADLDGDKQAEVLYQKNGAVMVENLASHSYAIIAQPVVGQVVTVIADLDGDGKNDLVWTDRSGGMSITLMNGSQVSATRTFDPLESGWRIAGGADLTGDDKADLLLHQQATGRLYVWQMDGTQIVGGGDALVLTDGERVAGLIDYTGDGVAELLVQDGAGHISLYALDDGMRTSAISLLPSGQTYEAVWKASGLGPQQVPATDLSGDGIADIVLRSNDGTTTLLAVATNGSVTASAMAPVDTEWTVAASGDVDGDGFADLVWRNADGHVRVAQMNGAAVRSEADITTIDAADAVLAIADVTGDGRGDLIYQSNQSWVIADLAGGTSSTVDRDGATLGAAGDLDGDGDADLVWVSDDTNEVVVQTIRNEVVSSTTIMGTLAAGYAIVGVGDFDGDGKDDLTILSDAGAVALWRGGATAQEASTFVQLVAGQRIAGIADYNGDGRADLLVQDAIANLALYTARTDLTASALACSATSGGDWAYGAQSAAGQMSWLGAATAWDLTR